MSRGRSEWRCHIRYNGCKCKILIGGSVGSSLSVLGRSHELSLKLGNLLFEFRLLLVSLSNTVVGLVDFLYLESERCFKFY